MSEELPRRKLRDIISQPADDVEALWNSTEAASEFTLLPAGTYVCRVTSGSQHKSQNGTPSYRLEFTVDDGEHYGRKLWLDLWLTPKAMPMTKRDLLKLGIDSFLKTHQALPAGYRAEVRVVVHKDDSGRECNEVRRFTVTGFDPPKPDPFAPEEEL